METLPEKNQRQVKCLDPDERILEIGKIIYHVNQLAPYPLNSVQIADWAKSINELRPNLDLGALKYLIGKMKTDEIEFDQRKGIQNIFAGLRRVVKSDNGYVLSSGLTASMPETYKPA